jgi:Flp pilus assembly protein TadG
MVEFAMAAGVFTVLLLAIFEFGLASWTRNMVTDAARVGTRYAIVRGSESGRTTDSAAVSSYVQGRTELSPITVTTTWPDGNKNSGSRVQVRVQYAFQRMGSFIPALTLSSTSKMVISF